MKKTLLTLTLISSLLMTAISVHATIRRVGFTAASSPVNGLDYSTLQAAHDASANGDTIQLYPSTLSSGNSYNATINKQLVILGPGYLYNSYTASGSNIPNAGLQNIPGTISSTSITIGKGSAGSVISGFPGLSVTTSNIPDSLNDITITRNRNVSIYWDNSGVCNNWVITQCAGVSTQQSASGSSFTGNRTITNFRIENCLSTGDNNIINPLSISLGTSPVGISSGQILNCTSVSSATLYLNLNNASVVVQNCIIEGQYFLGVANTIFINNITANAQLNNVMFTNPGSANNVFGVTFTNNSFFQGYPNNTSGSVTLFAPDSRLQLAATSPAKNAGIIPGTATPTDCGAYGGTNPYKASGIPSVPAFYKLSAPSSSATSSPYTISFSVRSNN